MKNITHYIRLLIAIATFLFACVGMVSAQHSNQLYVKVKRVEGQGNGGNWLNLTAASRDSIMAGAPWKVQQPEYEYGTSPVLVRIIDPTALQTYDYTLKIDPVPNSLDSSLVDVSAHWTLTWYQNGSPIGSYVSQHAIGEGKEEVVDGHGIAITVKNRPFAIYDPILKQHIGDDYTYPNNARFTQPDLIGSEVNYETSVHWLGGLEDQNVYAPSNWIRAGHRYDYQDLVINSMIEEYVPYRRWRKDDFFNAYNITVPAGWIYIQRGFMDFYGQFCNIVEGLWAPYMLTSPFDGGPKARYFKQDVSFGEEPPTPSCYDHLSLNSIPNGCGYNQTLTNLYSVDIVFTPDTSQWTRALVLEAGSSSINDTYEVSQQFHGQTYHNIRHEPKTCPSVDKDGNPDNSGTTGFGWFPGYAINVETGERLNIMFAENSEDEYNHGNDMIFNPTNVYAFRKDSVGNYLLDGNGNPIPMSVHEYDSLYETFYSNNPMGEPLYGGRHYVYICGSSGNTANTFYRFANRQRNYNDNDQILSVTGGLHGGTFYGSDSVSYPYYECGVYDEGKWLSEKFKTTEGLGINNNTRKLRKMQVFNNVMWTGIPMPAEGMEDLWLDNTATVKIRVTRPYMFYSSAVGTGPEEPTNENAPVFSFTTQDYDFAQDYAFYNIDDDTLTENHIDINNIDAAVSPCGGGWFCDPHTRESSFKYPKGNYKSTIFAYSFWMGGLDGQDSLHLFAETFHQNGNDTWPGPLSIIDASTDEQTVSAWNRTFKITRQEVQEFLAGYQYPDYTIPQHILDWPAHGNTTKGQAWLLAPFIDVDGDGIYNPKHGDYPDFPGDMAQFVIFNDNYGAHAESEGTPFGVEVHVLVYAYNTPEDTVMNNTLFFNYKVFNRSQNDYHDMHIGLWNDWDLGYGYDDYLGCDVTKNAVYCYNGYERDGDGQLWTYDWDWPVQTLQILSGPTIPADNQDNPAYFNGADCSQFVGNGGNEYAINGSGFGDGIADNERYGLTGFIYYNNTTASNGNPNTSNDYYNLMRNLWYDGSHLKYGANGHPSDGNSGIDCRFVYPGNSYPCDFGTYGVELPDSLLYAGTGWTESSAGNSPYDRRGIASMGPFNLNAGEMQEVSFCMVTLPHHYAVGSSGIYMDSLSHVNPTYHSQQFLMPVVYNLYETICEGEEYDFYGEVCDQSGVYSHIVRNTFHSNDIADTVYQLHLTVVPRITLIHASVQPGGGYHDNGFYISHVETLKPGTHVYTQKESSVDGCDHVTMLFLDIQTVVSPTPPVKIYPNPTTQYVIVEVDKLDGDERVMVYDLQGKLLQSRPLNDMKIHIDLSDYPAGIYLLKVGDQIGKVVKK